MRIKIIIMQDRYLCLTLHESNTPCLPYLFCEGYLRILYVEHACSVSNSLRQCLLYRYVKDIHACSTVSDNGCHICLRRLSLYQCMLYIEQFQTMHAISLCECYPCVLCVKQFHLSSRCSERIFVKFICATLKDDAVMLLFAQVAILECFG